MDRGANRMKKDPYLSLLDLMKGEQKGIFALIGTVASASPIKIVVSGLELDKDDLLVNEMLLSGYQRTLSLPEGGGAGTWTDSGIEAGDKVLLLPTADMQQYLVACVVKAVIS